MARVKVPQPDGFIQLFDGVKPSAYKVKDGTIEVAEDHVTAILASIAGSAIVPEAPASASKPEAPAKEK